MPQNDYESSLDDFGLKSLTEDVWSEAMAAFNKVLADKGVPAVAKNIDVLPASGASQGRCVRWENKCVRSTVCDPGTGKCRVDTVCRRECVEWAL